MRIKVTTLSALFIGCALLLLGSMSAYSDKYYSERDQIRARLESLPNVEVMDISGRKELFNFDVRRAALRLVDRPGSIIELEVPALGVLEDSDYILLSRIGRWKLGSCGERETEAVDTTTGKPRMFKTAYGYGHINIGSAGPATSQIPFTIRNIKDIISHYSELESLFEKWPQLDCKGEPITRHDNVVTFYLQEGS
jgi:hypothetical protein